MAQKNVVFKHRLYYSYYEDRTYGDYNSTMCLLDVSIQLRYSDDIPVYRVIFTPRRHISQQAINKLPSMGLVKQRWPHTIFLPFKLPDNRKLVHGQLYTDWTYCAACLADMKKEPSSGKALGEYFRKLNSRIIGGVDHYNGKENLDYTTAVEFFRPEDDSSSSYQLFGGYRKWMFLAAKFNTGDAILARSRLIKLKKIDEKRRASAIAANKSYHEFIRKTYEPLTAKYYIRHKLHCGDYEYRNRNRSAQENAKYIPVNRRYLRCLSARFKNYDLRGYVEKYPELKRQESDLWDKTYGTTRTKIGTPEDQVQAFNKRYKEIEKETKDMIYHANRAAENAARAERSRQGWANVFNNAMAQVRQDNRFIADHGLVVNSDNTVTTVKQARENAIQTAKMQAMLDSAKHDSRKHHAYDQKSTGSASNSGHGSKQAMQVAQDDTNKTHASSQDRLEKERLEKEKRVKAAQEKARLEKAKREQAKREEARRRKERLEKERRAREKIVHTVALTWQNKAGKWFACGPVQCIQAGEETEQQALDFVVGKKSIVGRNRVYRCNQYALTSMAKDTAGDQSEAAIRRRAKCLVTE